VKTALTKIASVLALVLCGLLLGGQALAPPASQTGANAFTGANTFSGTSAFSGDVTITGKLTASGAPSGGLTAGAGLQIGSYNGSTHAGIWAPSITASVTNYGVLLEQGGGTHISTFGSGLTLDASGVAKWTMDTTGNLLGVAGATKTRGTITLAAGTGTATVNSGAICVCVDSTANASVKCAVATTTLTATGTGTDVITYLCL
jgi:hypothetical protein